MPINIRLFNLEDYAQFVELFNVINPEYVTTVKEMRYRDEHNDPKCKSKRWVAEMDGQLVGYGEYTQFADIYHPRKFVVRTSVHPDYRRRGIGSAIYDRVLEGLQPFDPIAVSGRSREDWRDGMRFAQKRGFHEVMREWESRLDVAAFDIRPYAGVEDHVRAQGILIKTCRELESDPDRLRKLYELESELDHDVPAPEPVTAIPYEVFVDRMTHHPNLLPDAYFVAVAGDEYAGTSALWSSSSSKDLYTGLTGVRRAYRRKGIALALKIRGIEYAKAYGAVTLKTWNESNNRAMLSINERLGYVKQPAWVDFSKVIQEEEQTVTLTHATAM